MSRVSHLVLCVVLALVFATYAASNTTNPNSPTQCAETLSVCSSNLSDCGASLTNVAMELTELQQAYDDCGCNSDPCAASVPADYDQGLHIGAVFIILAASLLGASLPLTSTYVPMLKVPHFLIILGKCAGAGVILVCALIHMLQPAVESLSNTACLPPLLTDYSAYAYLFAVLACIVMHFLDYLVAQFFESTSEEGHTHGGASGEGGGHSHSIMVLSVKKDNTKESQKKVMEAYMLEFGVTVHSVFVGLAVGIVGDGDLRALLVALCFHQFFEGMALGSRIADAKLPSHWHEGILALVFSIAAPVGAAVGVGLYNSMNLSGEVYTVVQGVFDAVCAGILLYIGFTLLLGDFRADLEIHCKGKKHEPFLRAAMFVAMWTGAAVMAFIGKYL